MSIKFQEFIKSEYDHLKENPALKANFQVGDTIKVHQLIKETATTKKNISKTAKKAIEKSGGGDKGPVERIQVFEGVVIARKHGNEPGGSFTVRKLSGGIAVEKIYPIYSPTLKKIEIVSRTKIRRAKLYHLREDHHRSSKKISMDSRTNLETVVKNKDN